MGMKKRKARQSIAERETVDAYLRQRIDMNQLRQSKEEAHKLLHIIKHVLVQVAPEGLVEGAASSVKVLHHQRGDLFRSKKEMRNTK